MPLTDSGKKRTGDTDVANPFNELPPHAFDPNIEADTHFGDEQEPEPYPEVPYESPARHNVLNEPAGFDGDKEDPDVDGEEQGDDGSAALILSLRMQALQLARAGAGADGAPLTAERLVEDAKTIENYLFT